MTGNTLYYLTEHGEDTAPHETTLEGIRDYLRSNKPLLKRRYHNLTTLEALAWVKLSLDETGCWQTHPSMPVQANFFVLVDAYGSMTWDAESILSGRSLDVMLWGYEPEDVEWLLCMQETTDLKVFYDGGDSLPAIVPALAETAEDYEARKKHLTRRARAMLDRIEEDQHYPYERYMTSPVMAELVNAGLVKKMPRAVTLSVCYVPVIGFQPLVMDRVDVDTPAKPGAREYYLAAADLMNHLRTARNRLDILRSECSLSAAEQETVTIWTGEIDAIIAAHSPMFCGSRPQEPA